MLQDQVAREMDWSLSKVIRIEAGTVSISTNDARMLLQLYGVNDKDLIEELIALARVSRRKTWWTNIKDAIPSPYAAYIGLEAEANRILFFQPTMLPGILQTEAYARIIVERFTKAAMTTEETNRMVSIRMTRQREVLGRDPVPDIVVVLDQSVLHRASEEHKAMMREQLLHLVEMGEQPNITLQVMPFNAGPNSIDGPYIILQFPDPSDSDVMYVESVLAPDVIDQPHIVRSYLEEFERLRRRSLDEGQSLDLIKKIADEL
jgi:hypothetical protein